MSLPWESIRETLEVNLVAPMQLTQLVLPHMLARQAGHIVNIASVAAKCGAPYAATYCATKAGLAERDRFVLSTCRGAGLPLAIVMGGGYAKNVQDLVDIHTETIRLAAEYSLNEKNIP